MAASMSSFCRVRRFDFSAAPQARIDNSKMNTSQALANSTGAKTSPIKYRILKFAIYVTTSKTIGKKYQ